MGAGGEYGIIECACNNQRKYTSCKLREEEGKKKERRNFSVFFFFVFVVFFFDCSCRVREHSPTQIFEGLFAEIRLPLLYFGADTRLTNCNEILCTAGNVRVSCYKEVTWLKVARAVGKFWKLVKEIEDIFRRVCKFRKNSLFVLEFRVVGGNANSEAENFQTNLLNS